MHFMYYYLLLYNYQVPACILTILNLFGNFGFYNMSIGMPTYCFMRITVIIIIFEVL